MTDISIIKMITSVAVWHISVMGEWQVVGVGGTRPLQNVLGEALKGQFGFEARNYLFPELCSFRRVFCFPCFCKIWRQTFEPWDFLFRRCLGALFENCAPSLGIFLRTPTTTTSIFVKISILFWKQSRCYLPDSYVDPQAEQSSLVMVRRKLEWKIDFRTLARSSAEGLSIAVTISRPTSRLRWSMVQKRRKARRSQRVIALYRLQNQWGNQCEFWGACFRDRCFYRFALRSFRVCGCTVARRSGCRSGTAKKSSHPWHFWCWSPSRR